MAIRLDKPCGTGVEIWYRLQVVVKAERDLFRLKREMFKGRSSSVLAAGTSAA